MNTKIKSSRTFGVELECFSSDMDTVVEFADSKGHTNEHDGSINSERGYSPREIQTKVLRGEKGAEELRELCNFMVSHDTKTNSSCGTHIHFGGEGFHNFSKDKGVSALSLSKGVLMFPRLYAWVTEGLERESVNDMTVSRAGNEEYLDVFFEDSINAYKYASKKCTELRSLVNTKDGLEQIESYLSLPFFTKDRITGKVEGLMDGRNYRVFQFLVNLEFADNKKIIYPMLGTLADFKKYSVHEGANTVYISETNLLPYDTPTTSSSDTENYNYKNITGMLMLYSFINDLLLLAVTPDRRRTRYSRSLSSSYSISELRKITSISQLKNVWQDKAIDGTKYQCVNINPLFDRFHTIEIRFLNGTIDAELILGWAQFHQTLLDYCAENTVDSNELLGSVSVEEKVDTLSALINGKEGAKEAIEFLKGQINKNYKPIF